MDQTPHNVSRKRFLGLTLAASPLLALPIFMRRAKPKAQAQTAKLLTEDGRLVEVDVSHLSATGKKVNNADIHNWVKK